MEASAKRGFLRELPSDCGADEFASAVQGLLAAAGITFSLAKMNFHSKKSPVGMTELFNEYAGQSGITLYFIDLYEDRLVMGATLIADYTEAAEAAAYAGLKISSRP